MTTRSISSSDDLDTTPESRSLSLRTKPCQRAFPPAATHDPLQHQELEHHLEQRKRTRKGRHQRDDERAFFNAPMCWYSCREWEKHGRISSSQGARRCDGSKSYSGTSTTTPKLKWHTRAETVSGKTLARSYTRAFGNRH